MERASICVPILQVRSHHADSSPLEPIALPHRRFSLAASRGHAKLSLVLGYTEGVCIEDHCFVELSRLGSSPHTLQCTNRLFGQTLAVYGSTEQVEDSHPDETFLR